MVDSPDITITARFKPQSKNELPSLDEKDLVITKSLDEVTRQLGILVPAWEELQLAEMAAQQEALEEDIAFAGPVDQKSDWVHRVDNRNKGKGTEPSL